MDSAIWNNALKLLRFDNGIDSVTYDSIISKMIINNELMVFLDQLMQTAVMHHIEPTTQQNLALQLATLGPSSAHNWASIIPRTPRGFAPNITLWGKLYEFFVCVLHKAISLR